MYCDGCIRPTPCGCWVKSLPENLCRLTGEPPG
jgi:hypothetical protein